MSWNNPTNVAPQLRGLEPTPYFAPVQNFAPPVGAWIEQDPTGGRPTGNLTFFGRNSMPALSVSREPTGGLLTANQPLYGGWGLWRKAPTYAALKF